MSGTWHVDSSWSLLAWTSDRCSYSWLMEQPGEGYRARCFAEVIAKGLKSAQLLGPVHPCLTGVGLPTAIATFLWVREQSSGQRTPGNQPQTVFATGRQDFEFHPLKPAHCSICSLCRINLWASGVSS